MKYALLVVDTKSGSREDAQRFLSVAPIPELLPALTIALGSASWLIPLQSDTEIFGHLVALASTHQLSYKVFYFADEPTLFEKK